MSDFDTKVKRSVNDVKRGIRNLRSLGLKIEIDKNVENMFGCFVDNIYVVDYITRADKKEVLLLQRYLFTVSAQK